MGWHCSDRGSVTACVRYFVQGGKANRVLKIYWLQFVGID